MKTVRRILGVFWLLLAALAAYFCVVEFGLPKFATGKQDDLVFGIIIFFILLPMVVTGLTIFGWYAITDEYED